MLTNTLLSEVTANTGLGIIELITKAVGDFFKGLGTTIVDGFNTMFLTAEGGLTTFATVSLVFMGLSLALGLFYGLMKLIRR